MKMESESKKIIKVQKNIIKEEVKKEIFLVKSNILNAFLQMDFLKMQKQMIHS